MVFESRRVHRSIRCKFSREPWKSVFGEKFVTSTTSVLPSQRPRESPHHWRLVAGRCGAIVFGKLRDLPCPGPGSWKFEIPPGACRISSTPQINYHKYCIAQSVMLEP